MIAPTTPDLFVRGRLAPTPTGHLHLGNARSFLVAWLAARSAGGSIILRVEDIDEQRVRPEYEQRQIDDLRWLGLDWDEGPDIGGPHGPYRQSERLGHYHDALTKLKTAQHVYPCICSRKEILASAPHAGEEIRYPGTCRGRFKDEQAALGMGREPAWRLRVNGGVYVFNDAIRGTVATDTDALVGDFVVMRNNGWPSYQLAVAVDDAAMGITQIVRGDDLLHSTARQIMLSKALGHGAKREWAHLPLVLDETGKRMAKRDDACAIKNLRAANVAPERVVGMLAHSLGLVPTMQPVTARDLVREFAWDKIVRAPVILTGALLGA